MDRHLYLSTLHDNNETLFFRTLLVPPHPPSPPPYADPDIPDTNSFPTQIPDTNSFFVTRARTHTFTHPPTQLCIHTHPHTHKKHVAGRAPCPPHKRRPAGPSSSPPAAAGARRPATGQHRGARARGLHPDGRRHLPGAPRPPRRLSMSARSLEFFVIVKNDAPRARRTVLARCDAPVIHPSSFSFFYNSSSSSSSSSSYAPANLTPPTHTL